MPPRSLKVYSKHGIHCIFYAVSKNVCRIFLYMQFHPRQLRQSVRVKWSAMVGSGQKTSFIRRRDGHNLIGGGRLRSLSLEQGWQPHSPLTVAWTICREHTYQWRQIKNQNGSHLGELFDDTNTRWTPLRTHVWSCGSVHCTEWGLAHCWSKPGRWRQTLNLSHTSDPGKNIEHCIQVDIIPNYPVAPRSVSIVKHNRLERGPTNNKSQQESDQHLHHLEN
jgi:hypothetical protein